MQVRLKLMGMLREKTPDGGVLDLADGATVDEALAALGIPADHVHLVMIDGGHVRDRATVLAEGVELTLMPPVGGG